MRTFVFYTLARLGLFVLVYGAIWLALFRTVAWNSASALYTALIAMVGSSLLAFVVLRRLRAAFAAEIAQRSQRSRTAYDTRRRTSQHGSDEQAGEDAGGVGELGQAGVSQDRDQR